MPPVTWSQEALEAGVQVHELAEAVTWNVRCPNPVPPAPTCILGGVRVKVQFEVDVPGCVTVKVWFPTVMVPVRVLVVVLAVALYATVPLPVPDVDDAMVRKEEVVAAVQVHDWSEAVKLKLPVPPVCGTVPLDELRVKVQLGVVPPPV